MESGNFSGRKGLHITHISANNLKNVRKLLKMQVYAEVSVIGSPNCPKQEQRTPTDKVGGTNPAWNHPMSFTIPEKGMQLVIKLYCDRSFHEDPCIGQFQSSIRELFTGAKGKEGGTVTKVFPLEKGAGSTIVSGELKFSYRFGEGKIINNNLPNPKPSFLKRVAKTGVNMVVGTAVEAVVTAAGVAGLAAVLPQDDDNENEDEEEEEEDDNNDEEDYGEDEEADGDDEDGNKVGIKDGNKDVDSNY